MSSHDRTDNISTPLEDSISEEVSGISSDYGETGSKQPYSIEEGNTIERGVD